jgi:hypothetical protein
MFITGGVNEKQHGPLYSYASPCPFSFLEREREEREDSGRGERESPTVS